MSEQLPSEGEPLSCLEKPLPLEGFKGTSDEIEQQWYDQVYKGSGDRMKQLTWRAVIVGMLLGGVLSITNIYAGLRTGWAFGVALTAGIISFSLWRILVHLRIAKSPMTILENTCMQSSASAAGYSTGGTLISAIAALLMIQGVHMPLWQLMGWVFFLALMGVTMAIPMKRQMINIEQIKFPDSIAIAETLKVLYSHGQKAVQQAKALVCGAVVASICTIYMSIHGHKAWQSLQQSFLGDWYKRTVNFDWDFMFIGAGIIIGMKTTLSMLIGGTICWVFFLPWIESQGLIETGAAYKDQINWTLWGGTACMVVASLISFAFQWKSILRSFASLKTMFSRNAEEQGSDVDKIETPMSWFLIGQLISFAGLAYLGKISFDIPLWMSAIATFLTFFLALVVCRITGEANITPIGAMGKVTQLAFAAIAPGHVTANLMAANITAGAASSSADLMVDLKTGYLLGANPRKQFLAQFSGIFLGTIVSVLAFRYLIPDAEALNKFEAPSAHTWKAMAEALSLGLDHLHPIKVQSIIIGSILGVVLALLPKFFPKASKWIPSPIGFGLAWAISWNASLLFFTGALIGMLLDLKKPEFSKEFKIPSASGLIAGGSLTAVALLFIENFRSLF